MTIETPMRPGPPGVRYAIEAPDHMRLYEHDFWPWYGCQKVSPGCDNCFAAEIDRGAGGRYWGPHAPRKHLPPTHWAEPLAWNAAAAAAGRPAFVLCGSYADAMDNQAPGGERERLWHLVDETPWLTWLVLTKRPQNFARFLPPGPARHNVWLGVGAENEREARTRIPILRATPAVRRFVCYEPALGPVDWGAVLDPAVDADGEPLGPVDWIIAGAEVRTRMNGRARPADPDWFRAVRDICADRGIAFWLKQASMCGRVEALPLLDGRRHLERPEPLISPQP